MKKKKKEMKIPPPVRRLSEYSPPKNPTKGPSGPDIYMKATGPPLLHLKKVSWLFLCRMCGVWMSDHSDS